MKKRFLSNFIIIFVLIFNFNVAVTKAYKTGDDYPAKYKNAKIDALVDEWNFYNRECTSFVAWCLNSRNGVKFTNQYGGVSRWGHAKTWGTVAKKIGITVNNDPAVGSVAWWNTGEYGHVAWVKAVNGDNVVIDEYNYRVSGGYGERTLNKSNITGFIHIKDIAHTHSYDTYVYKWAAHPHYNCYRCSCGEIKERTNEPNQVDNCEQCTHTHSYDTYVYKWAAHPHYNCYRCSCGEIKERTNEPNQVDSCEQCTHTHSYDTYVYKWAAHPHYNCYRCSCGEIKERINEPNQVDDCEQCVNTTLSHEQATNVSVADPCSHSKTITKTIATAYNQNDKFGHTVITKYDIICSECSEIINSNLTEEVEEVHTINSNRCTKCNYEIVEEVIAEKCNHTNTYQGKIKNTSVKIKNDTHHSTTETYDVICYDCGEIVEKDLTGIKIEEHNFLEDTCSFCNYEKEVQATFTDVTDSELIQIVSKLSKLGIINGYEDKSFKPHNNITRAEFSKMICITGRFDVADIRSNNFEDVTKNHWARSYIYTAQSFGIINGISETAFAPEANITYEQAIKMIVAALGYSDEAMQKGGYPNGYIEIADEQGILNGIHYRNRDYATRANIAKMVDAAMNIPFYTLKNNNGTIERNYSQKSLYEIHNN